MLIKLPDFKLPNFSFKDIGNYFDHVKGQLHLPDAIVDKMKGLNVHSVEDFASYIKTFPSEAAKILNTSVESVQEMAKNLPGADRVFPKQTMGARDPKELDDE